MGVDRLLVAGAGQMGAGIAQVGALAGIEVLLIDISGEFVRRGVAGIELGLGRMVEKGKIDASARDEALARIRGATDLEEGADADLFIEAAPEDMGLKQELLERAAALLGSETVIATNTSSLSVSRLSACVAEPGRFVGIHFFNPVPVMALVEVVRGTATADATVAAACEFAERLGKSPIVVADSPGFVVNRVLFPMINEAAKAFAEGVASAADIDTGLRLGANWPMGPLALADLVGLDTTSAVLTTLERELGDPAYRPAAVFAELLAAGKLGRKSGAGFFDYGS